METNQPNQPKECFKRKSCDELKNSSSEKRQRLEQRQQLEVKEQNKEQNKEQDKKEQDKKKQDKKEQDKEAMLAQAFLLHAITRVEFKEYYDLGTRYKGDEVCGKGDYLFLIHFANPDENQNSTPVANLQRNYPHKTLSSFLKRNDGHILQKQDQKRENSQQVFFFFIPTWKLSNHEWPILRVESTYFGKQYLPANVVHSLLKDDNFPGKILTRQEFKVELQPTKHYLDYIRYLRHFDIVTSSMNEYETFPFQWLHYNNEKQ